ncbi:hypothetical protein LINPERHAP1_LOCUS26209, partial [Linum perenne]
MSRSVYVSVICEVSKPNKYQPNKSRENEVTLVGDQEIIIHT